MNCKNCNASMRTDFVYCPGCGAKVVRQRLTFKGLFTDIMERFFNLENSFYRTLKDMTVRPEEVVLKYVEGTRRRYMTPMNYLGVSLAVSGVLMLAMRHFAMDKINFDVFGNGMNSEAGRKVMDVAMEYNSFILILYIPVIALVGWLTLNSRNHNLPEHVVSGTYIISHITIISAPVSLLVMLLIPENYMKYSLFFILVMVGYILFVSLRVHPFNLGNKILRSVLFTILFFIGYMGVSIFLNIIMFLTGQLSIEDFRPPAAG